MNDTANTVLDHTLGHITIINTYEVEPGRADELLAFLVEATQSTIRHVPGFLSANLHVAIDRTRIVNYAQWKDQRAITAARENPEVLRLMQEQLGIAKSFAPVLYALRASIPAAG